MIGLKPGSHCTILPVADVRFLIVVKSQVVSLKCQVECVTVRHELRSQIEPWYDQRRAPTHIKQCVIFVRVVAEWVSPAFTLSVGVTHVITTQYSVYGGETQDNWSTIYESIDPFSTRCSGTKCWGLEHARVGHYSHTALTPGGCVCVFTWTCDAGERQTQMWDLNTEDTLAELQPKRLLYLVFCQCLRHRGRQDRNRREIR